MATYYSNKTTETFTDDSGSIRTTTKESTSKLEASTEPDFIKIYTQMWCEFNQIPETYRELFFQLAIRMNYCTASDLEHSQIVITYGSTKTAIQEALGWKDAMYYKGLNELCKCGAIKKISRSEYQINPQYAARGQWKYNPRLNQGGVEDLVAVFNFKNKTVETQVVWADDGTDSQMNNAYRAGLGVKAADQTVLKTSKTKKIEAGIQSVEDAQLDGQLAFVDNDLNIGEGAAL